MKKIILTLILTVFIFSVPTFAKTEIGGVTLPDTLKVGNENLVPVSYTHLTLPTITGV